MIPPLTPCGRNGLGVRSATGGVGRSGFAVPFFALRATPYPLRPVARQYRLLGWLLRLHEGVQVGALEAPIPYAAWSVGRQLPLGHVAVQRGLTDLKVVRRLLRCQPLLVRRHCLTEYRSFPQKAIGACNPPKTVRYCMRHSKNTGDGTRWQ
jgi:hypothetical protein